MKHLTVSILENMEVYGSRLAAYISQHEDSPFTVRLYLEHPVQGEVWKQADVVLITSSLTDTYKNISEGSPIMILDEDGKGAEGDEQSVYKYQSAFLIYERLLGFCMDRSGKRIMGNGRMKKEFVINVVYSPGRGKRVMEGVLMLCRQWAGQSRVLYMNLEQVPVFQELLGDSGRQEGMSDLIYFVKQRKQNIGARIGMMTVKGEFDYLLPVDIPAETSELNEDDWKYCMESIRDETEYEQVVIDFGASVPFAEILSMCTKLIIVHGEGQWEKQLTGRFRQMTERMMGADFAAKIREIEMDTDAVD